MSAPVLGRDPAQVDDVAGLLLARPPRTAPAPEPCSAAARVVAHGAIGARQRHLVVHAPGIAERATGGQFAMVTVPVPGGVLPTPRPMAIHRRHPDTGLVEFVYAVVGAGTRALARVPAGAELTVTGPLGRGFEIPADARRVLVVARGTGVCGVMGAVEDARARGLEVTALLSAREPVDLIGPADCAELGATALPVTDAERTSSLPAVRALLHERLDAAPPDVVLQCGSPWLAHLVAELAGGWGVPAQTSVEAHMACGLGYCHGCATPREDGAGRTVEGPLVCVDGPVFALRTGA